MTRPSKKFPIAPFLLTILFTVLLFQFGQNKLKLPEAQAQTTYSVTRHITDTRDDMEQALASGPTDLGSSDFPLMSDLSYEALRFRHISVPKNATVTEAYIQFTAYAVSSDPTNLEFRVHDIGNSPPLHNQNTVYNIISSLPLSTTSVSWSPPAWNSVGEASLNQQTSDLSPLVQSLVNRSDWEAGNNLTFVITGTGNRQARAYDRRAYDGIAGEAVLTITYQANNQPPSVTLTNPITDQVVTEGIFTIAADASDPDGSIDRVEFLIDEVVVGVDSSAPYSVDVSGIEVYKHKAVARAYDNQGLIARSTEVEFKVQPAVPAFPGAEGFGAYSKGGRGGRVIKVTNLDDSGPGSLRECVETNEPRTCIFTVAGYINLNSHLRVERRSYLTIAGQTAPGQGITIRGPNILSLQKSHDLVLRHLRIRNDGTVGNRDCLNVGKDNWNTIIDHFSCSWATDEGLSSGGESVQLGDLTIQRSIVAEGLVGHSMGSLISGGNIRTSLHHNLYANNDQRNPKLKGDTKASGIYPTTFDFVNNVIYNWDSYASACSGTGNCNLVANYWLPGPINYDARRKELLHWSERPPFRVFMDDNIGPNCPNGCDAKPQCDPNDANNVNVLNPDATRPATNVGTADTMCMAGKWRGEKYCMWWGDQTVCDWGYSSSRLPAPQVTTTSADQALTDVLTDVGSNRRLNQDGSFTYRLDDVDQRIISSVSDCKNQSDRSLCTGFIPTTPADVGGFPVLDPGTAYADTDNDGMADVWEVNNFGDTSRGDPNDSSGDFDADGYTDLEEFLNGTNPLVAEAGSSQPTSTPLPTPTPTPTPLPGDANGDRVVDGVDYVIWLNNYNQASSNGPVDGDFNGDQIVDGIDYVVWLNNYGA